MNTLYSRCPADPFESFCTLHPSAFILSRVDLMGVEPTTPTLQGSVAPSGMQAHREVRPGIEPGPPPYHGGMLPEHLQTILDACTATLMLTTGPALNYETAQASTRK